MSELYSTIGSKTYDQLLADPQGAEIISIPCKPGNGTIGQRHSNVPREHRFILSGSNSKCG